MPVTQDIWNKMVTGYLLVVFTAAFFISYFMNRPIDITSFLTVSVPILSQVFQLVHSVYTNSTAMQAVNSNVTPEQLAATKNVLQTSTVATTNGASHD